MSKMKFRDILIANDGIVKGPFGGDIKKAYFVPKAENTYKVYEQGVVYSKDCSFGTYYIDSTRYEKLKRFSISTGDILITGAGTLGELYVVPEKHEEGVINQALIRIRVDENVIDKEFFLFYFKWYLKNIVCRINGDSVIPNLPPLNILKEMDIDIPDIRYQKQIGKILKVIDDKIESNIKINTELESMAKMIYDYWFLQFDFPNEEGKPYKSFGGKMVWNAELKREIPEGWEVAGLEKFGTLGNGINYDKDVKGDKTYKIVKVRNISSTSIMLKKNDMDDIQLLSRLAEKYLLKENDILIARSGIPGAVRLLDLKGVQDTIYCGFIICYSLKNDLYKRYLVYKLKDYENTSATTSGGTIIQNVSQDTLKRLRFPVPSINVIKKFNDKIDSIWKTIQKNDDENQELVSLQDFLLPLLMNGQIMFKDN